MTLVAQATNQVEQVRLAFAAGERAAFCASDPGMGSLECWPMSCASGSTSGRARSALSSAAASAGGILPARASTATTASSQLQGNEGSSLSDVLAAW